MPEIQILLAVYNGAKFVEEQINSILDQSYSNIHLVIRDNCSTDQTVAAIQKIMAVHPDKISLLLSPTNDGVIGNFAKLAEFSTAPYIMFSDADDVWHKDKALKSMAKMQELEKKYGQQSPILVHSDLTVVNQELEILHPSFWSYSKLDPIKGNTLSRQLMQNVITGCTTLLNRPLLDAALPFPNGIVMHDWWIGLVATAMGHVDCVSEATMLYRQHGNNDTGAKKYGLKSYLQRFRSVKEKEKIGLNIEKKHIQAQALLDRFENQLNPSQQKLLQNYILLKQSSFFKKRYAILKNGFFKQGFLRNLLELLPHEWLLKS
jgi:glycosyltransferase involved in cell wall biosynthesis